MLGRVERGEHHRHRNFAVCAYTAYRNRRGIDLSKARSTQYMCAIYGYSVPLPHGTACSCGQAVEARATILAIVLRIYNGATDSEVVRIRPGAEQSGKQLQLPLTNLTKAGGNPRIPGIMRQDRGHAGQRNTGRVFPRPGQVSTRLAPAGHFTKRASYLYGVSVHGVLRTAYSVYLADI